MPPDQMMMQGAPEAPPEQAGTAVTITKLPDGTFTVAPDTDDAMGQPEATEPAGQPAATLQEALALAGKMLDGGEAEQMSVEQAFGDGFNGGQPQGKY